MTDLNLRRFHLKLTVMDEMFALCCDVFCVHPRPAHRGQPPLRCLAAPGPASAPGLRRPVEGDEAEGCVALCCFGGVCDLGLRDRPRAPHRQTPEQVGPGAQGTGESAPRDFMRPSGGFLFIFSSLRRLKYPVKSVV